MHPLRANRRVLLAAMVGTTVEYYDFFIYGTAAALIFGPLFFPAQSPAAQMLLSFMSFGIAFVARPVGAVIFGHFGDRMGRKSTLVASLFLMGVSTLAIAFLPTYAMAGWIAPLLLCVMRFGQGLGLGGEWAGAALLAIENAPDGWHARFGAAPQLGVPLGFLAANGLFLALGLMLTEAQFASWGWRIPFLLSAVLVALGLWVRLRIGETAAFQAVLAKGRPERVPIVRLLRDHSAVLLAGGAGVIVTFATFYLVTAFALAQATGSLGYPREAFLGFQLAGNFLYAIGIVIAAIYADRISPAAMIALGGIGAIGIGVVFGPALESRSLPIAGTMLLGSMFIMGFSTAPLGSWLSRLFPVEIRYSGVAFAFNFGGIIGGAVTPVAAQMLSAAGAGRYTGGLLVLAGVVTLIGVRLARPSPRPGPMDGAPVAP